VRNTTVERAAAGAGLELLELQRVAAHDSLPYAAGFSPRLGTLGTMVVVTVDDETLTEVTRARVDELPARTALKHAPRTPSIRPKTIQAAVVRKFDVAGLAGGDAVF
jgi:hypothetical protein